MSIVGTMETIREGKERIQRELVRSTDTMKKNEEEKSRLKKELDALTSKFESIHLDKEKVQSEYIQGQWVKISVRKLRQKSSSN